MHYRNIINKQTFWIQCPQAMNCVTVYSICTRAADNINVSISITKWSCSVHKHPADMLHWSNAVHCIMHQDKLNVKLPRIIILHMVQCNTAFIILHNKTKPINFFCPIKDRILCPTTKTTFVQSNMGPLISSAHVLLSTRFCPWMEPKKLSCPHYLSHTSFALGWKYLKKE